MRRFIADIVLSNGERCSPVITAKSGTEAWQFVTEESHFFIAAHKKIGDDTYIRTIHLNEIKK